MLVTVKPGNTVIQTRSLDLLGYLGTFLVVAIFALCLSLYSGSSQADNLSDISDRVEVDFEPVKHKWVKRLYHATVIVTNTSAVEIQAPLRLVITEFKNKRHMLKNADGVDENGFPYIDIDLPGGVLGVGQTSEPWPIVFKKMSGKSWKKLKAAAKARPASEEDDDEPNGWSEHDFPIKFNYLVVGGEDVQPLTISAPDAVPGALKINTGTQPVRFTVSVVTSVDLPVSPIVLRGSSQDGGDLAVTNLATNVDCDDCNEIPLNDDGINGDLEANDGIFTATEMIDTDILESGQCRVYVGVGETDIGGVVESDEYLLCATHLPIELAESDTTESNQIPLGDATVVGNEVLVRLEPGTPSAALEKFLRTVHGAIVGTQLEDGLYQVAFDGLLSPEQLAELMDLFREQGGVVAVEPNYIGLYTSVPSDPEFGNQHGLRLVSANDLASEDRRYVWDAGATGAGAVVVVLDSGVQPAHPDDIDPKSETNGDINDVLGHGTGMAGIIGATTDNETAIAAMARDTKIRSVRVSKNNNVTLTKMLNGFKRAKGYAGRNKVISASFSISHMLSDGGVCRKINQIINRGAIVVVSAGNENDNAKTGIVPGNCNSSNFDPFTYPGPVGTSNKQSLIVVGASACTDGNCDTDSRWTETGNVGSNFGNSWVDISAPGVNIPATSIDSGSAPVTGTSPAAALVAGAVAILRSCDVGGSLTSTEGNRSTLGLALEDVFNALDLGATVPVAGVGNRLNVYHALSSVNTVPIEMLLSADEIASGTDTTGGLELAEIQVTDDTVCDAHSLEITGGSDADKFSIGSDLENMLVIDDGVLDFGAKPAYEVEITAHDFYGESVLQTFTITILD